MKEILNYPNYYATEDGQIYSGKTKRFLTLFDNNAGYLYTYITQNGKGKAVRVNRLIALTFIPLPTGFTAEQLDVGHKDNDKYNNKVDNLYWCTRRENLDTDSYREKAKHKIRSKVRCVETGEVYSSIAEAGRAVGINRYGINLCLLGKQITAKGYHWERVFEDNKNEFINDNFDK